MKTKTNIILGVGVVVVIALLIYFAGVLYRVNYVDMKVGGWQKNCNLMLNKVTDSDTAKLKNLLIDLEGYGEDKIAYNEGIDINSKCYELNSNRKQFISRYIWFGTGFDSGPNSGITRALEVMLIMIVVILVIIGLIIGFSRLEMEEDNDDSFNNNGYY